MFPFDIVSNTLSNMSKELERENMIRRQASVCPKCKTTLEDFLDTGFVGCSKCYEIFKPYAKEMAFDIHGRANHVGKVPKIEATKAAKKQELEKLIKEKEIAVKNEDYILADELKSKIARIREEL